MNLMPIQCNVMFHFQIQVVMFHFQIQVFVVAILLPLFSVPYLLYLYLRMRNKDKWDRRRARAGYPMLDEEEQIRRQKLLDRKARKENGCEGMGAVKTVVGIMMDPYRYILKILIFFILNAWIMELRMSNASDGTDTRTSTWNCDIE